MYFHNLNDAIGRKVEVDDPDSPFNGDCGIVKAVSGTEWLTIEFADDTTTLLKAGSLCFYNN